MSLLEVEDLRVRFDSLEHSFEALRAPFRWARRRARYAKETAIAAAMMR
jgi:hypothetical protein